MARRADIRYGNDPSGGCVPLFAGHEGQLSGASSVDQRTSSSVFDQFANICGTVYRQGNVLFTPDGNSLLSPVGNRVAVFDLVKFVLHASLFLFIFVTFLSLPPFYS